MIYEAIQLLFPGITDAEFSVRDDSDGNGPYIEFWSRPEPMPTMDEIEAVFPLVAGEQLQHAATIAVQRRLDEFALTRAYDGILSATTYATSKVPSFRAEGQYAVEARDDHWAKCYEILTDVQNGVRPMPSLEEVLSELPVLRWPDPI